MNDREKMEAVYRKMNRIKKIKFPKIVKDLTHMDMVVLSEIIHYKKRTGEDINFTQLSEKTCYPVQSLSRTIKNLEQKGFLIRETSKENRRKTIIKFTKHGMKIMEHHKKIMDDFLLRVFSYFSDEEINTFIQFEEKLFTVLETESKLLAIEDSNKED